jgi:voltage-gated potassium channel
MEDKNNFPLTRLKKSGIAFLIVILIGTFGYRMLVEGTSWFDGLYMTFLTVTTIGFSEVVNLDGNTLGRIFTIFIAISGISILTFSFSNVAALIIESNLSENLKRKRKELRIQKMKDHYIICGAGRVGIHVAEELEKTQRNFVICDRDESVIAQTKDIFQFGEIIVGDCTDEDFLTRIGIEHAKGFFVTTRNDHYNIVICLTARQLRKNMRIVSNCQEPESIKKLKMVGANKVISPSFIGGLRMASEMVRPMVTTFLDEMLRDTNLNLRIEELPVPSHYHEKRLETLPFEKLENTLLLAVREGNKWKFNPSKNYILMKNSALIFMASPEELQKMQGLLDV